MPVVQWGHELRSVCFVSTLHVQAAPPYTPNIVNSKALLFVLASGLRTILHNLQILSIHFTSPFLPPDCQLYLSQRSFCFDWKFPKVSSDVSLPPLSCHWAFIALTQMLPFFQDASKPPTPIPYGGRTRAMPKEESTTR